MKQYLYPALLIAGVVAGYVARDNGYALHAPTDASPLKPSTDDITCRKLTVRGDYGNVTIGTCTAGTYVALSRGASANVAFFIDPRGVPHVQYIDESGRARVTPVRHLIDASPRVGETLGTLKP